MADGPPEASAKDAAPRKGKTAAQLMEAEHSRQAALEKQHWVSCGKQVSSSRPTRPTFSFGGTGRIIEDVRAKEICQHPSIKNPGPVYTLPPVKAPCPVVKHWGLDKRFLEGDKTLAQQGKRIVGGGKSAAPTVGEAAVASPQPQSRSETQPAGAEIYAKYASEPQYTFGSSNLGARFINPHCPMKAPAVTPHSARVRFRELRDMMPKTLPPASQPAVAAVEA
jgi:hypothetical protein